MGEGWFTFNQLSYIASANYDGYLVGSLFFCILQSWEYIPCSLRVIWCSHSNECAYFCSDVNNKLLLGCLDQLC
ncbi:YbfB/YjiJ family MFS transporter [Bartonella queenslandensis]|uniref:YbfB/YjiJ family MFS transporter n=1 Tax=Bartonella queenslandensis TaxID=481138 RepID=UPI00244DE107|nr:YbfB/YjiJ family MFS transporter [Bartonella queenslandensis]